MVCCRFPYFFVGTFIEAWQIRGAVTDVRVFPYFFVGTFIEATDTDVCLRMGGRISLLFRRDFH